MADIFVKKTWSDRIAEYITRRTLTKEDGSTEIVTVERNEGEISQEGDAFDAATMNDLEDRIASGFDTISNDLVKIKKEGAMPLLDFDNPLDEMTSIKSTLTAPQDCYLWYSFTNNSDNGTIFLRINGRDIDMYKTTCNTPAHDCIRVKKGAEISITGSLRNSADGVVMLLKTIEE